MFGQSPIKLALAVLALLVLPASARADTVCKTTEVSVVAGAKVTLKLDCRGHVAGSKGRKATAIVVKPTRGALGKLTSRTGRVVYTARTAGRDVVRYTLRGQGRKALPRRDRDPRRPRGRSRRAGPAPAPAATPVPVAATPPGAPRPPRPPRPGDGLPAPLPDVPALGRLDDPRMGADGLRHVLGRDPRPLLVVGPDGKRYPTWHPPTYTDPATGRTCTFGHEHGDDPATSDIAPWVAEHLAAAGYEEFAGLPFGLAAEALNAYADAHPGTAKRSEDHVGYKVDVADDVRLLGADGGALGVTCDYLTVVHQGSHSADALSNNAHELLYATRCDDGTQLISTTLSRFGDPGTTTRSCEPATRIQTTDNGYPDGAGERLIPDRECVERNVLVPAGRTTSAWALYEKWTSGNTLTTAGRRHARPLRRELRRLQPEPLRERRRHDRPHAPAVLGDRGRRRHGRRRRLLGGDALAVTAFDDPRRRSTAPAATSTSPARRSSNAGGHELYWTDPYGGNASPTPFPGAVCQLVSPTAKPQDATIQVFGRNRSHDAEGVHAPN